MSDLPTKYQDIVNGLKEKIRQARINAVYTVNAQLLAIYWEIGKTILEQQQAEGWGTKVIDRLSQDLRTEFPDMKGLNIRNIKYMRAFAEAYPNFSNLSEVQVNKSVMRSNEIVQVPLAQLTKSTDTQIMQAALAQLSWYHHITILDKVKDPKDRLFYIQKTIENGWSRDVMVHQIEGELHKRQGQITNNFQNTISPPHSELVQQVFKDPYKFEFIYLGKEATERDLEDALTNQITKFLLELGQGFAFIGRQYKMNLGEKEYFFDLLFYHTRLKRYIVIELKIDEFKPEYKGKIELYLTLADEQLKQTGDEASIGIILCKNKDKLVVEYALRNSNMPIGVAEYKILEKLPAEIRGELPTVEQLETEMERQVQKFQKPVDKKLNKLKDLLNNLKNEEVKEKRTPKKTAKILSDVVWPLQLKIIDSLKEEIIPLFESADYLAWTDTQGHRSISDAVEYLNTVMKSQCQIFKFEIQLHGFKKAGIKTFDTWKDLRIQLGNYSYTFAIGNTPGFLLEKLYHQLPDETEITYLIEKFDESLLDDINQQVERISQANNE
ncbi:MAG: PDDEXK nuclease domain-containing protein [Ignavibacteriaceae bacterium]|jgi:predicted nuclease of restriction endonuclease-like (RecB) superfamily